MSDWFLLPHLNALRIGGDDAAAFAHAQFTSKFPPPNPHGWQLTSWCNRKGRVVAVILARCHENNVDLIVPAVQFADFSKALKMYAIGRQVSFEPAPAVAGSFSASGDTEILATDADRSLALDPAGAVEDTSATRDWQKRDVTAGIAWLAPATSGRFLPQSLGLEERGGLSYQKGCYPGQEIVARVHYLGKTRERLMAFRQSFDISAEPATGGGEETPGDGSGDEIIDETGKVVGHTLNRLTDTFGNFGLAVISTELPEEAALMAHGQALSLLLPESL